MPSTSQQTLLAAFTQAQGSSAGNQSGSGEQGLMEGLGSDQGLVDALGQATQVIDAQTQATSANTDALAQSGQAQGGSSAAKDISDVANTASQVLGGGLSLLPLVSLFSSLFGGGQSQQPAPLVPYSLPPSLNLESTTNNQQAVWGENGLPHSAGSGGGSSSGTQVTVQVQAMDSQSFLDRSDDIAQAVRQAMLNMNSINDVITNM